MTHAPLPARDGLIQVQPVMPEPATPAGQDTHVVMLSEGPRS
ncbi:hypothetical protein [Komagataeibacter medellinensis]|nr:hypothetical protein [Komagataeibacter medellinensis]